MADTLFSIALAFLSVVIVAGLCVVLARDLLTDDKGRWPWDEERRLDEELRLARARVEFAEKGVRLHRREEAARRALEKRKKRDG